jgi:hypothetical protein
MLCNLLWRIRNDSIAAIDTYLDVAGKSPLGKLLLRERMFSAVRFFFLSLTIWMVQLTFIVHHHHGFMSVSSTIRSTLWSSRFRSRHSNLWTSNFIIIDSILREIASRRSLDDDFWTSMKTGFRTRRSSWWLLSTKTFLMFVLSPADLMGSWNELHTHISGFHWYLSARTVKCSKYCDSTHSNVAGMFRKE